MASFVSKSKTPAKSVTSINPTPREKAKAERVSRLMREGSSDSAMSDAYPEDVALPPPSSFGRVSSSSSSLRFPSALPPPSPYAGMVVGDQSAAARMAQSDTTEILNGFIQRFRDMNAAYQRESSQSGFGSVSSYSLGLSTPVTQPPQPPFVREQSLSGFTPPPTPLREGEGVEGEGVEGVEGVEGEGLSDMHPLPPLDRTNSVASSVSAFASRHRDISEEEMRAAGISQDNIKAVLDLPDIAAAPGIAAAEAAASVYAQESASVAHAASVAASANQVAIAPYVAAAVGSLQSASGLQAAAVEGLQSEVALHAALQPQQQRQAALLRNPENQGLLDNIDNEFNELISEIFNSGAAKGCLFIIRRLNSLFALIISAIGKGLGFAIKYPKLALLLIGLAYLQSSTCASIINKTIKFIWWITTYLFGMTTAGQKIAGFIRQIIGIYKWCEASGMDSFAKFQQLVEAVADLQKNMGSITEGIAELRRLAASLGISVEELMQIIISMQSTFSQPAPGSGVSRIIWDMLGNVAVPVVLERLGAGAAAAGPRALGMGGGKRKKTRKSKSKTNKKRKSKSNKKGKTKTRRR